MQIEYVIELNFFGMTWRQKSFIFDIYPSNIHFSLRNGNAVCWQKYIRSFGLCVFFMKKIFVLQSISGSNVHINRPSKKIYTINISFIYLLVRQLPFTAKVQKSYAGYNIFPPARSDLWTSRARLENCCTLHRIFVLSGVATV